MKPMFWVWSCTSPNYPKFKWGNTGWALPFVMVSSGLKCFRMRNDPFLGLHNFWQASASKQTLVLGQRVDLMEFARSFTVNIHTFSLTNSGTWNRLEIAGRWSIPKLDYQYQRVYRLVGHQSCPFLVGLVSRFPAVHRPLLTYVNTAFVDQDTCWNLLSNYFYLICVSQQIICGEKGVLSSSFELTWDQ